MGITPRLTGTPAADVTARVGEPPAGDASARVGEAPADGSEPRLAGSPAGGQTARISGLLLLEGDEIGSFTMLGVNATADATNRLSVKSPAVLFDNEGASSQVKVNKAASGDTASLLFQQNYSGFAEIGLVGSDDFVVKVSPDGSSFTEAIRIDKDSGRISFPTQLYYDDSLLFPAFDGKLVISADTPAPGSLSYGAFILHQGKGDNASFIGVGGIYVQARDRSDVDGSNKGVLYGLQVDVAPQVARDNSPFDDCVAVAISNAGSAKATEAIYVGIGVPTTSFGTVFASDANSDYFIRSAGDHINGLDFNTGGPATFSGSAILLPNNSKLSWQNAANNAALEAVKLDASNILQLGAGATSVSIPKDVTVTSADAGAAQGPTITLDRNSASAAGADVLGAISFSGRSSTGVARTYGLIRTYIADAANGLEDGVIQLIGLVNGSLVEVAAIGPGILSSHPAGGIGYTTGAGGAVTQATNKSTGVTLNKVTGQITMNNALLANNAAVIFTLTNSTIGGTDTVTANYAGGGTASGYVAAVSEVGSGAVAIRVTNVSGADRSEAIKINFNVHKGAAS